jgi:hypothetical protein
MTDILLDAHGTWDPASKPAYALVPKESTLRFYSENLKLFLDSSQARDQLLTAEPNQVVEGFKWAQNYTVSEVTSDDYITPAGLVRKTVSGNRLLCTSDECGKNGWHDPKNCAGLFAESDYQTANIYFAACRFVKLEKAREAEFYEETGVNQAQVGVGADAPQVDFLTIDEYNQLASEIHNSDEALQWWAREKDSLAEDRRDVIRGYIQDYMFGGADIGLT